MMAFIWFGLGFLIGSFGAYIYLSITKKLK